MRGNLEALSACYIAVFDYATPARSVSDDLADAAGWYAADSFTVI